MTERWRRALARLDEIEPDVRALREKADAGFPMTDHDPHSAPNRLIVAMVALIVAVVPLVVVVIAFRSQPEATGDAPDRPAGVITYARVENATWVLFTVAPDGSGDTRIPIDGLPDDVFHPTWSPDGSRIAFDTRSADPSSEEGGNRDVYAVDADGSNLTRLTTEDGWDYQPAWSPDGSRIAFVRSRPTEDIWVMEADGTGQRRLTHDASFDLTPTWSPDGSQLAFVSNRSGSPEIYTMDADGTNVTRLTHDDAYEGSPAWSPDGSQIAFAGDVDGSGLYLIDSGGGEVTRVVATSHAGSLTPSWSGDGNAIAFVTQDTVDAQQQIRVLDVSAGTSSPIVSGVDLCCPAWSHASATSSIDSPSAEGSDEPDDDQPTGTQHDQSGLASPRNGPIVFTGMSSQKGEHLFLIEPDGTGLRQLTSGSASDTHASWSPDGRQLVFQRYSDENRSGSLFVLDVESGATTQITHGVGVFRPAWSPDGSWIAFAGVGEDSASGIFVVRPDGTDLHRLTDDRFFAPDNPVWSPDSSTIAFTANLRDQAGDYVPGWDGYLIGVDGSGLRNLTATPDPEQSEIPIGWLPGGTILVATGPAVVSGGPGLPAQRGAWLELTPDGTVLRTVLEDHVNGADHQQEPSLSPDGRFAVYDNGRGGPQNVWIVELPTGRVSQITTEGGWLASWGPAP